MKIRDLSSYKNEEVQSLLGRIPFYRELQSLRGELLHQLLAYSCIVELDPGEVIMRRGDKGSWLYFLIKGRLSVYLSDENQDPPLNHITPGELFGDLALLCDHERKATVAADRGEKKVLLFATDFKPFGRLEDFSSIALQTKLIFYRTMVHSIRWRLEVKRMERPDHPLAVELRQLPANSGEKGGVEELGCLYRQAQFLAAVLDRWNSEGAVLQDVMVVSHAQERE
jgi:hypothetical protein